MKLINPFKKKQQVNQNKIIEIKYSKLDNIGKVKRFEIPDTTEMNNEINSLKSKITELENNNNLLKEKFDKFNIARGFCSDSFDFSKLLKIRITNDYVILDWKSLSDSITYEVNDSTFNQYLKKGCKYIQKVYLSTLYWGDNHWNYADHCSPILLNTKTFYIYSNETPPEKLTFTFDQNQSAEPRAPLSSLLWQNNLVNLTYNQGYAPDITKKVFFKVIIELIRVPINNNYLEENN